MPSWLSLLCLILGKKYTIWHYGLFRSPGNKLYGNMQSPSYDRTLRYYGELTMDKIRCAKLALMNYILFKSNLLLSFNLRLHNLL